MIFNRIHGHFRLKGAPRTNERTSRLIGYSQGRVRAFHTPPPRSSSPRQQAIPLRELWFDLTLSELAEFFNAKNTRART